jgi:hypothetical protein
MTTPQTSKEASDAGYELKLLTPEQARKLVERMSGPAAAPPRMPECGRQSEGRLCWEGPCGADHMRDVLYCDGTQGCTVHARVPC